MGIPNRVITQQGLKIGVGGARTAAGSEAQGQVSRRAYESPSHSFQVVSMEGSRRVKLSGKRPPSDEVASAVRQLSVLVRAGVPLVESLQGLAEQTRSHTLKTCLEQMANDVSQGTALSDAFAKQQGIFPALAAEMSRVAETGGNLAETLDRLATHLETSTEISRKVKSAMAYPIVILAMSIATVLAMVTIILPRFMKLFDQMGAQVPWTTKVLLGMSHALISGWYYFVIVTAVGFYLIRRYLKSERGRSTVDALVLRMPVVGEIVSKIVVSRVMATMATLLASGVPMVKTLETSATAANNEYVKRALLAVKQEVAEGTATSQALRAVGVFPPMVLQMVASGEKTGELPAMLEYVCSLYARETDAKVKALTSIIEPVMIVFLGMVVGFIATSVIAPIYSLVGGVK